MFFTSKISPFTPAPLRPGTARQPQPPPKNPPVSNHPLESTQGTTGLMGAAIFRSFLKSKPLKKGCCRICSALKRSWPSLRALKLWKLWGWWAVDDGDDGVFWGCGIQWLFGPKRQTYYFSRTNTSSHEQFSGTYKSFGFTQVLTYKKNLKQIHPFIFNAWLSKKDDEPTLDVGKKSPQNQDQKTGADFLQNWWHPNMTQENKPLGKFQQQPKKSREKFPHFHEVHPQHFYQRSVN